MNSEKHALLIGKIVTNLQSLEFVLRGALFNSNNTKPGPKLNSFKAGDIVPKDELTDYSGLGDLIKKYNSNVAKNNPHLSIDPSLVILRDAIAHGRVSSDDIASPLKLLKFSKPFNHQVKVVFAQEMTEEWLEMQIDFTRQEAMKVAYSIKKN